MYAKFCVDTCKAMDDIQEKTEGVGSDPLGGRGLIVGHLSFSASFVVQAIYG